MRRNKSGWPFCGAVMGAQLHQVATREGMQTRTTARCAHCEPGGCIGRFGGGGFKAGERATPTRGHGAGRGAGRARRAGIDTGFDTI